MKKKYNFRRLLGYIPILLVAVIWLSGSSVYGQSTITEVISSGSSWTVPCGVTAVDIEVYAQVMVVFEDDLEEDENGEDEEA